jgi:hypothetical protein
MAAKTDPACFIDGSGNRFGDVMQQHRENERHRNFFRKKLEHQARVLKDVALGVELFRLQDTFHSIELGQNRRHQPT